MIVVFFWPADAEHHGEQPTGEDENHAADGHEGTGRESEETDGSEDERDNDGDVATHRAILWVGARRRPSATALMMGYVRCAAPSPSPSSSPRAWPSAP